MPLSEDTLNQARHYLARKVAEGFDAPDVTLQNAVECVGDELDDDECAELEAAMPRLYEQTLAAHRSAVAKWPRPTDCDRLDAAFDELNAKGIVARHNWTCCQNCGNSEMAFEIEQVRERNPSKQIRGAVYYHQQDTERVAEGGSLFLAFGSAGGDDSAATAIAREVVDTLCRHGLQSEWNGGLSNRITVPMNWQRRSLPERWATGGYSGTPAKYRNSHGAQAAPAAAPQPKSLLDRVKNWFGRS